MNIDATVFLTGVLIGTILLLLGLGIGWFLGRGSKAALGESNKAIDQRQVIEFMQNFANWTKEFAGDFSSYQAKLSSLSQHARAKTGVGTKEEVNSLLREIMEANDSLQARLESTESKLESQTRELSEYLTEARTDSLTGLPNRRAFDQFVNDYYSKWMKENAVFSIGLLDIDFFKSVNDTYGHPAGDAVLIEISLRLKEFAGDSFKVGRYGGEEFAILLPFSVKAAAEKLEQLRRAIAGRNFKAEEFSLRITTSIGVAQMQTDERLSNVYRRSDEALYTAKLNGRNRIYFHNGQTCECFGNPGPPEQRRDARDIIEDAEAADVNAEDTSIRTRLQQRFDQVVAHELKR